MKLLRGVIHECPPTGGTYTPCCLSTPAELPLRDLYSRDPKRVTCTLPQATGTLRQGAALVVDSDGGDSPFGWLDPAPST